MKKKNVIILCVVSVFSVFMPSGCTNLNSTTEISYACSVSPEETCTLNISRTIAVQSFNDEKVNWKAERSFTSWASVQIPAGSHTFFVNYNGHRIRGSGTISYDNFIAGRTYQMIATEGGLEARGFAGAFQNINTLYQTMKEDTFHTLRIGIKDVTEGVSSNEILYGRWVESSQKK